MSAKPKTTYTAVHPTTNEILTETTTRKVSFFTFGWVDGTHADDNGYVGWRWIGVTSIADPLKAQNAGRASNPYYAAYKAVAVA